MSVNKQIILIGGASTTGKSTVAKLLAKHLDLPWISTDQILEIMRSIADKNVHQNLFEPEGYDAKRFLTEFSAEKIAEMEMARADAAWIGISKFINNGYPWLKGFVVEGVDILPHLVARDFKNNKKIKSIFLVDENADRIRDVVFNRGLWDEARKYSDDLKEKEVEWVLAFSHKLKSEAEKYGYPLVEVSKHEDDLGSVLESLKI